MSQVEDLSLNRKVRSKGGENSWVHEFTPRIFAREKVLILSGWEVHLRAANKVAKPNPGSGAAAQGIG
jgi:hypothetical protein